LNYIMNLKLEEMENSILSKELKDAYIANYSKLRMDLIIYLSQKPINSLLTRIQNIPDILIYIKHHTLFLPDDIKIATRIYALSII